MKNKPMYFSFLAVSITALAACFLRFFQLIRFTDSKTGFVIGNELITYILYGVLILSVVFAVIYSLIARNKIRKIRPDISITTDVIVGFPNETDKNFNETIETIKKVDFSKLHVFPYSKREGTKAATMEGQIKEEVKKQRVMELLKLSKELENKYMNKFIGKTLTFIPEVYKDGYLIGHTGNYLLIKLKGCEELLHKEVSVKLMENQYPYIISSAI